jgi:glycosyltransferase involved in cell wall biosynthesis
MGLVRFRSCHCAFKWWEHWSFIASGANLPCCQRRVENVRSADVDTVPQTHLRQPSRRHNGTSMPDGRPVIYDMTRLVTRVTTDTPNGIDRVDLALAKHFASRPDERIHALIWTITGPRLMPAPVARAIVHGIETWWQEGDGSHDDRLYEQVVSRLTDPSSGNGRIVLPKDGRWGAALDTIWNYGLRLGRSPACAAPRGAAYINASNFPLEYEWHVRWLRGRADVRPVFFIHDLLPIEVPQYFWTREPARHRRRLEHIRQLRGRAVVASAAVAAKVASYFKRSSYSIPILQAVPPVAPAFHLPWRFDPRLEGRPYFIVCGTIEPRKNHILLLHIWRHLAQQLGDATPALIVAGKRGWNSAGTVALLERSRAISRHVIEVAGLPTLALKRLMDGARALLSPSFSEGFGLPVAEALAAGVPVIASDIDAFRERPAPDLTLIDSLDGLGWLKAILEKATLPRQSANRDTAPRLVSPSTFTAKVERFVNEARV